MSLLKPMRRRGIDLGVFPAGAVYVLLVFEKKSKKGGATPLREVKLIEDRLREAARIAKGRNA